MQVLAMTAMAARPRRLLVAVIDGTVSAGPPKPADDYLQRPIDLTAQLVPRPSATFLVRATGCSMRDAGIADGDELVVDRSLTARDGQIVIARLDDEFLVKTIRLRGPGSPKLVAAHPDYPPISLAGREAEVWGVVTYVLHHAP